MPPHFTEAEFADRAARTRAAMAEHGLDALLLFAPESHYWLTGYDTFGFCFFQCLVFPAQGEPVLLTRSADLRQARHTSIIEDIRVWKDEAGADPSRDLRRILKELQLHDGARLGVELETQGLTAANWRRVKQGLKGKRKAPELVDASRLIDGLRLVKSAAEIECVRRAAALSDAALEAGVAMARPGVSDGAVLAAMQAEVLAAGGDYPANEFICGSGEGALLCRYFSGRRRLESPDQLTLEWAGTWRRYHAPMMNTLAIGEARPEHGRMRAAAREALESCESALRPGATMGDVFEAHAVMVDRHGYRQHRLNACGYSVGARFTPSWMDPQMFYEGNETEIGPGMTFFLHMILMDSDTGAAQTLGRTSLVTEAGAEPLSRATLDLIVT